MSAAILEAARPPGVGAGNPYEHERFFGRLERGPTLEPDRLKGQRLHQEEGVRHREKKFVFHGVCSTSGGLCGFRTWTVCRRRRRVGRSRRLDQTSQAATSGPGTGTDG